MNWRHKAPCGATTAKTMEGSEMVLETVDQFLPIHLCSVLGSSTQIHSPHAHPHTLRAMELGQHLLTTSCGPPFPPTSFSPSHGRQTPDCCLAEVE